MSKIFTPTNQIRLTNVALVRYKKAGRRFEIACYKNKVMNWRNKIEKDISEVLQSEHVFSNVSKGVLAKKDDLVAAFGSDDEMKCCLEILEKGEVQVSEKERQEELESKSKDVATIIAQKCVNKETKRPFPVRLIETALKDINFVLKPTQSAKQQALLAIKELAKTIPIERAQMRLRVLMNAKVGKELKAAICKLIVQTEEEEWGDDYESTFLIDPGSYRDIDDLFRSIGKGKGSMEILDLQVRDFQTEAE